MPRVIGVDIPSNKRLEISLTYIYGVGRTTAKDICDELRLDRGMKAGDLSEEQITALANYIQKEYEVEGTLRRQIAANISRLRDIGCYRGLRLVCLAMAYFIPFTDFLPATVFLGPLRPRAFVRVR